MSLIALEDPTGQLADSQIILMKPWSHPTQTSPSPLLDRLGLIPERGRGLQQASGDGHRIHPGESEWRSPQNCYRLAEGDIIRVQGLEGLEGEQSLRVGDIKCYHQRQARRAVTPADNNRYVRYIIHLSTAIKMTSWGRRRRREWFAHLGIMAPAGTSAGARLTPTLDGDMLTSAPT